MRQNASEEKIRAEPGELARAASRLGRAARFSGTTKKTSSAAPTDRPLSTIEQPAPAERARAAPRAGAVADSAADAAGGEVQAVQRGEPRQREPERERLDRAHQPGRHAQADQRAADREHGEVARQARRSARRRPRRRAARRPRGAGRSGRAARRAAAGTRAKASRYIEVRKPRSDGESANSRDQVLRDHGVDVAEEERQEVARRERAEHHKHGVRR